MDSAPHFSKLFSEPAIKIIVGEEKQTFYVPENALLLHGSWFKKCLTNDTFIENQSRTIVFPKHTRTAFSIFLFWIFHGTFPQTTSSRTAADDAYVMTDYIETYLLGQYLMIDDLKDAAMNEMCRIAFPATILSYQDAVLSKSDSVMIWNYGEEELKRFMVEAVVHGRTLQDCKDFTSFTEVRELNVALNKELARRRTFPMQRTKIAEWCLHGKKGEEGESLFVKR